MTGRVAAPNTIGLSHQYCPGPPSPKTFKIWVGCLDRGDSASLTGMFKTFLVEGFRKDPCERIATLCSQEQSLNDREKGLLRRFTRRKGSRRILISLYAHSHGSPLATDQTFMLRYGVFRHGVGMRPTAGQAGSATPNRIRGHFGELL